MNVRKPSLTVTDEEVPYIRTKVYVQAIKKLKESKLKSDFRHPLLFVSLTIQLYYFRRQKQAVKGRMAMVLQLIYIASSGYIIIKPAMDDLSLVLASRDLFLSLATLKVKTLKQAADITKQHPNSRIDQLLGEYQRTMARVAKELHNPSPMQWNHALLSEFEKDPLKYYLTRPAILQILGSKGSGKTALLLRLALNYHSANPTHAIKLLNCAGGITLGRLARLGKTGYDYCDIFAMQDLIDEMERCRKDRRGGLLAIDSMVNLLLGSQRQKLGLGELLLAVREAGWSVYFTNYTQSRLEVQEKEGTNLMGYFSQTFGGIPQCKLTIDPDPRQATFSISMIKSIDSKYYYFSSSMDSGGLGELSLQRRS